MYCTNCGNRIPEGHSFCTQCGAPVDDTADKLQSTPAAPTAAVPTEVVPPAASTPAAPAAAVPPAAENTSPGGPPAAPGTGKKKIAPIIVIAIAAVVCVIGIVAFALNRSADKDDAATDGSQTTETADGKSSDSEKAAGESEKAWKNAYRELLESNRTTIERYEYPEYGDPIATTALCDLNDDGVPELLCMLPQEVTEDYTPGAELHIYTCRKGKAIDLDYDYPEANRASANDEGRLEDVPAASGTTYVVYKAKGTNGFGICDALSDEGGYILSCEYSLSSDYKFTCDYWKESWDLDFETNPQSPEEVYTYYHGNDTISKSEYDKAENRLAGDMDRLLLFSYHGHDCPVTRKAESMDSEARFCSDMIRELTTE